MVVSNGSEEARLQRLDLVYFDVTSGHRSAAQAIAESFRRRAPTVDVRLVNLVDILASDRRLQRLAHGGIDLFNWCVRHELPLFQRQQIGFFQVVQRNLPDGAHDTIGAVWRAREPDLVASVIPICNGFLQRALHRARPACPYVVIPVDMTEGKDRYWFDPADDAHYLNPGHALMARALEVGIAPSRATRIAGMPIDPAFYDDLTFDRAEALSAMGLDPRAPTVLVSFGGHGSVQAERCAASLEAIGRPLNVIFLCGRHDAARRRIERRRTSYRKVALGFTPEPPVRAYALSDVVVGKPGSMTLTEAMIMRRPIVAVRANTLAVVQRGNEDWVRASGVGAVVGLPDVGGAVRRLLDRDDVRAAIERHWHRGVDDITDHLLRIGGETAMHP